MNKLSVAYRCILVFIMTQVPMDIMAQCAMCRTTLENNVSQGDIGIAANLNFGILYLFVTPYLLAAILGYFWYRSSRAHLSHKESLLKLRNLLSRNST